MRGRKLWQSTLLSWEGVPYSLGYSDRTGADCVGFLIGALREYGYPSLPRSLTMLLASPAWIPTPISRAASELGILLWGWNSLKITNVDSWSVNAYSSANVLEDTLTHASAGYNTEIIQCARAVKTLKPHIAIVQGGFLWQLDQASKTAVYMRDVLKDPISQRLWSWWDAGTYYPFQQSFHHVAALLDRRNVIHSTITSQANGVQIQPLGKVLSGEAGFDNDTVAAFAELFGIGINLLTEATHTLSNMTINIRSTASDSTYGYASVTIQADFEVTTGIVSGRLNPLWLEGWRSAIGPDESDARAAYFGDSAYGFAAANPTDDAFFV